MLNKIWDLSGILKWDHTTSNSFRLKNNITKYETIQKSGIIAKIAISSR